MAPPPFLDSDNFERLPSPGPSRRKPSRRDAGLMSDGSTFVPATAPESSGALEPSTMQRQELRDDLKGFGFKFPPGRPRTTGPILPQSVVSSATVVKATQLGPGYGEDNASSAGASSDEESTANEQLPLARGPVPAYTTGIAKRAPPLAKNPMSASTTGIAKQAPPLARGPRPAHTTGIAHHRQAAFRQLQQEDDDAEVQTSGTGGTGTPGDKQDSSSEGGEQDNSSEGGEEEATETSWDNPFQLKPWDITQMTEELFIEPGASTPVSTGLSDRVTQALNPLRTKTRGQLMQAYQQAKAEGSLPFVDFIYDIELACTTLQGADRDWTIHEAHEVYISFPEKIIDGLIDGTLPRLYHQAGSEERRIQEQLRDRAITANHPAYYMITITDRDGEPPQHTHVRAALHFFEMYINGDFGMRLSIDKARGGDVRTAQAGKRWYLDNEHGRLVPRRLQACQTFARNLRAELDRLVSHDFLRPFPHYLVYFGITGRLLARFEQHDDGRSSNHILQLFRACLAYTVQYSDDPHKYKLQKYVVGLCGQPHHAPLGEILVSRLGQGYITSGTGFAHYPAGRSINISLTAKQWAAHWEWMYENTPYEENFEATLEQLSRPPPRVLSRQVPVQRMILRLIDTVQERFDERFMEGRVVEAPDE